MAQGKAFTKEQKEVIIESLRPYLEMGFSRIKACRFIGLDNSTLSKWTKADEALSIKLQSWENAINMVAMQNIANAIAKESETEDLRLENTWKWADRKMKDDGFSTRAEVTGKDGEGITLIEIKRYEGGNNTTT